MKVRVKITTSERMVPEGSTGTLIGESGQWHVIEPDVQDRFSKIYVLPTEYEILPEEEKRIEPMTFLNPPDRCQLCGSLLEACGKFYDAPIRVGPNRGKWACMCPGCHHLFSYACTGVGFGQLYEKQEEQWVKIK